MKLQELLSVISERIKTEVHCGVHDLKIQEVMSCRDKEVKYVTIKGDVLYIELVSMY